MLIMIYRITLLITLILPFCVTAQNKTSYQAGTDSYSVFNLYNSEVFGAYPFQLTASGELQLMNGQQLLLMGTVKHQRLNGSWVSFYPLAQKLDEGNLVKGVPDGTWKTWFPNGQLKSLRHYSADLFFKVKEDIELNHPKISRFVLTERYKKEGEKILQVLSAGYSFRVPKKSPPSDLEMLVNQNGQLSFGYHPPFVNMLHHGLYVNYFENGNVQDSGYYKEGLRNGLWFHYLTDGTFWKGLYKNGNRINDWKYYSPEGKLLLFIHYNYRGEEEYRKKF
jgi:antitoxin component YwqK of YwqJK toxin-antitoxin module